MKSTQALSAAVLLSILGLLAVPFAGTIDVAQFWDPWAATLLNTGLFRGYAAIADYPPLASVILWSVRRLAEASGLSFHLVLKLSLWLGATASVFATAYLTRDALLVCILWTVLTLNGVALGYLDVYLVPPVLVGVWALLRQRHGIAFGAFLVASFIKWQPLVLWPVLGLYLVQHWRSFPDSRRGWIFTIACCAAGMIVLLVLFGPVNVWQAFRMGVSHQRPSANALNLGWVLQPFFSDQGALTGYLKVLYLLVVSGVLLAHSRSGRPKPRRTLEFGLILAVGHVVINGGAHENHWLLASVLAVCLAAVDRKWRVMAIGLALINNLNLLLFYGVSGKPVTIHPMALWFIAVGVVVTSCMCAHLFRDLISPSEQGQGDRQNENVIGVRG